MKSKSTARTRAARASRDEALARHAAITRYRTAGNMCGSGTAAQEQPSPGYHTNATGIAGNHVTGNWGTSANPQAKATEDSDRPALLFVCCRLRKESDGIGLVVSSKGMPNSPEIPELLPAETVSAL